MRVKSKIEASPPKQAAPASAEAKRARLSHKMAQSPKKRAVDSGEVLARGNAFEDELQVSLGVHSSASHNWKQPSRAHKAGGDWTMGRAVRVWWDGEKRWYEGVVLAFNGDPTLEDSHGTIGPVHTISYDDGVYDENLSKAKWELDENQGRGGQALPDPCRQGLTELANQANQEYGASDYGEMSDQVDEPGVPGTPSCDKPGRDDDTGSGSKRGGSRSKIVSLGGGKSELGSGGRIDGTIQQKRSCMVSKAANTKKSGDSRDRRSDLVSLVGFHGQEDGTKGRTKAASASPSSKGGRSTRYSSEAELCDKDSFIGNVDGTVRVCDPLLEKVVLELLRMRRMVSQIPECVHQEVERCEAVASLRQAQTELKDAEDEVRRASEAACGARCEEGGHIKAAEKARADQEVQRTKMRELVAEEDDVVHDEGEGAMLRRVEAMIKKGDEARSALAVLDHIPALTKATTEHKVYEDNLHKVKQRGDTGATLMDAFQGFAAQAARSEKARAEASARAQRAEKEHSRLKERFTRLEETVSHHKRKSNACAAPMPRLNEWIFSRRSRDGIALSKQHLGVMAMQEVGQNLKPKVSEMEERASNIKEQLEQWQEEEQEYKSKVKELSERSGTLSHERCKALQNACDVLLLLGEANQKSQQGNKAVQDGIGDGGACPGSAVESRLCQDASLEEGASSRCDVKMEGEDGQECAAEDDAEDDVDVVLARLKQAIATTRDAAGAVKALKNVPQSKKSVLEFKVLWDKMQEELGIFEQLSARNKELKTAVEEWDDHEDQLKDAEQRLAAARQRIAELEQASEELQQDVQFAKKALIQLEEEREHKHCSDGKSAARHRPLAALPCKAEGSQDVIIVDAREGSLSHVVGSRAAVQTKADQEASGGAGACDEGSEVPRDDSRKRKADEIDADERKNAAGGGVHVETDCKGEVLTQTNHDESGSDTAESGSSFASASATMVQPFGGSALGSAVDGAPLTPATRPRRDGANRSR